MYRRIASSQDYLSETRRIVKRSHGFLKLAKQKFLFVHFFACRVAEETGQYRLDHYMKESLVAYVKLELTIIQDPEYSADFSEQSALKERVLVLLWTIYSKYMFYLTGRSCRLEVYAIILKFLHAELPSKIPAFFRDFCEELKNLVAGTSIALPYFSSPVPIKAESCEIPQNIFHEDPNTSGFILDELKKMQKQADDRRQMEEQTTCIEIEDDDDDDDNGQDICIRSISAAPPESKPRKETELRGSSRHSSETLDLQYDTRELTNRAKEVLLQFRNMFGSEGVSMSINGNGKIVIGTTLSLDQNKGSEALWETASSASAGNAPLRPQNYPQYRPCFEAVQRSEIYHRASVELGSSRDLAMFAAAKPCKVVLPNRHEVLQSASFLNAAEEPIDLSRHGLEEPEKAQAVALSQSKSAPWDAENEALLNGNSSCSSGSLIVDEDKLLQLDDEEFAVETGSKAPALNILSVKVLKPNQEPDVVLDSKIESLTANPDEALDNSAENLIANTNETLVNAVESLTANPNEALDNTAESLRSNPNQTLGSEVESSTANPDEALDNSAESLIANTNEALDNTVESLTANPNEALDNAVESLRSNPNQTLGSEVESLTANPDEARDNSANLSANTNETLVNTVESLTANPNEALDNAVDSLRANPNQTLGSEVESLTANPVEALDNSSEILIANLNEALDNTVESSSTVNPNEILDNLAESLLDEEESAKDPYATEDNQSADSEGTVAKYSATETAEGASLEALDNVAQTWTGAYGYEYKPADDVVTNPGKVDETVEHLLMPVKPLVKPCELAAGFSDSICTPVEVMSPVPNPNGPVLLLNLADVATEQWYQVCNERKSSDCEEERSDSDRLIINTSEPAAPIRSRTVIRHKTKAELKQEIPIDEETDVDDDLPLAYRLQTTAGKSQNRRRSTAGKSPPKSPAHKRELSAAAKPRKSSAKAPAMEEVAVFYTSKLRSRSARTSKDENIVPVPVSELPTPERKDEEKAVRSRGRPRKKSTIKRALETSDEDMRSRPPVVSFCQPAQEEKKQPQLSKVVSRLKENLKKPSLDNSEFEPAKKRKATKRSSSSSVRHVTAETSNSSEIGRENCKSEKFQKGLLLQSEISNEVDENVTEVQLHSTTCEDAATTAEYPNVQREVQCEAFEPIANVQAGEGHRPKDQQQLEGSLLQLSVSNEEEVPAIQEASKEDAAPSEGKDCGKVDGTEDILFIANEAFHVQFIDHRLQEGNLPGLEPLGEIKEDCSNRKSKRKRAREWSSGAHSAERAKQESGTADKHQQGQTAEKIRKAGGFTPKSPNPQEAPKKVESPQPEPARMGLSAIKLQEEKKHTAPTSKKHREAGKIPKRPIANVLGAIKPPREAKKPSPSKKHREAAPLAESPKRKRSPKGATTPPQEKKKAAGGAILEERSINSFDHFSFNIDSGLSSADHDKNSSFATSSVQDPEQVYEALADPAIASSLVSIQQPSLLDANGVKQECASIEPCVNGLALGAQESDSWIFGNSATEPILVPTSNNLPVAAGSNVGDYSGWQSFAERLDNIGEAGLLDTDAIKQKYVSLEISSTACNGQFKGTVSDSHNFPSLDERYAWNSTANLDDYSVWPSLDMLYSSNASINELLAHVMETETQPSQPIKVTPEIKRESSRRAARKLEEALKIETSAKKDKMKRFDKAKPKPTNNGHLKANNFSQQSSTVFSNGERPRKRHVYAPIIRRIEMKDIQDGRFDAVKNLPTNSIFKSKSSLSNSGRPAVFKGGRYDFTDTS
ncbi:hypothetical protein HUJ05_009352 [Dendroctonus ponderosae]|nr:hypothetical protein HUJ05_009352 [Dendroctonus ponderosae]